MSNRKSVKRQLTQEMVLDPQGRVRHLSELGSSVAVDKAIPIKRYFRSGSEMERQARVYYAEGQFDKAFILYNKFATLFLEKLPKQHPEYSKPEYKQDRSKIKKLLKEAFPRAEELKRKLTVQFEAEKDTLEKKLAEEAERKAAEQQRLAEEARQREEKERRVREETERKEREKAEQLAAFLAGSGEPTSVGSETRSGGEGLEQTTGAALSNISYDNVGPKQEEPLDTEYLPASQTGQTSQGEVEQVTSQMACVEVTGQGTETTAGVSLTATNPDLAQVLPPTYEAPPTTYEAPPTTGVAPPTQLLTPDAPSPSSDSQTPMSSVRTYQSIFSAPISPAQTPQTPPPNYSGVPPPTNPYYSSTGGQGAQYPGYYTPGPPPQGYSPAPYGPGPYVSQASTASSGSWGSVELPAPSYHMAPPINAGAYQTQTIEEEEEERTGPPDVDRSTKPTYSALSTSIGGGYRMVYIPGDISHRFEDIASTNTRQNIETCGILAGTLSRNQLHITHIIVPKQKGGPDSCETLNEEELFDVQDQHDLITLGWIHTHPSQTAFMSSVDLHTHCSYQIMLDEAIAIVCAPKFGEVGVYMLTEPYGLDYITHCEEEGFHTHPKEPPLYEECKHVVFASQSSVNIVDLR